MDRLSLAVLVLCLIHVTFSSPALDKQISPHHHRQITNQIDTATKTVSAVGSGLFNMIGITAQKFKSASEALSKPIIDLTEAVSHDVVYLINRTNEEMILRLKDYEAAHPNTESAEPVGATDSTASESSTLDKDIGLGSESSEVTEVSNQSVRMSGLFNETAEEDVGVTVDGSVDDSADPKNFLHQEARDVSMMDCKCLSHNESSGDSVQDFNRDTLNSTRSDESFAERDVAGNSGANLSEDGIWSSTVEPTNEYSATFPSTESLDSRASMVGEGVDEISSDDAPKRPGPASLSSSDDEESGAEDNDRDGYNPSNVAAPRPFGHNSGSMLFSLPPKRPEFRLPVSYFSTSQMNPIFNNRPSNVLGNYPSNLIDEFLPSDFKVISITPVGRENYLNPAPKVSGSSLPFGFLYSERRRRRT